MSTGRDRRQGDEEDGALAGGEFTDELSEGQREADDASGSTQGAEDSPDQ